MNFNFGEVLTRAWQIIWKHKVLWIFGVFAGCGRGSGGGGGGGTGGGTGPGEQPFPQLEQFFVQLGQWIEQNTWIVIVLILLVLVLIVLAIFLGTIGRIGLIRGTYQADMGAERLNFGELFSESMPYFWRTRFCLRNCQKRAFWAKKHKLRRHLSFCCLCAQWV